MSLTAQQSDIYEAMRGGVWKTLTELEDETGHGAASISAQLRNLRKPQGGEFVIERRPRDPGNGRGNGCIWEYRIMQKVEI